MGLKLKNVNKVNRLIKEGHELPWATENYPSRGQTAVQKLYQTKEGKLFLKKTSQRNHHECQIKIEDGTLAEREYWAYLLASSLNLRVPELILIDPMTTVQVWLDYPDARQYTTHQRPLDFNTQNVFECALFDWLTGQIDRHDANYLYDYVNQEIILIDSGHAFLKYAGSLPDYLRIFEAAYRNKLDQTIHSSIHENLKKMSQINLKTMVPLKKNQEQDALLKRLHDLVSVQCIQEIIKLFRGTE